MARSTQGHETFTFYELDPVHGIGRELAKTRWIQNMYGDWSISPNGEEVAIPEHAATRAGIRIVSLRPGGHGETEVSIPGLTNISGLNWTADGKGWFVVITTSAGRKLFYVDRNGRTTALLDGASFAVPSPDGKRVALMIPSVLSNVWSVEQ